VSLRSDPLDANAKIENPVPSPRRRKFRSSNHPFPWADCWRIGPWPLRSLRDVVAHERRLRMAGRDHRIQQPRAPHRVPRSTRIALRSINRLPDVETACAGETPRAGQTARAGSEASDEGRRFRSAIRVGQKKTRGPSKHSSAASSVMPHPSNPCSKQIAMSDRCV